jgi:hypothetical protein
VDGDRFRNRCDPGNLVSPGLCRTGDRDGSGDCFRTNSRGQASALSPAYRSYAVHDWTRDRSAGRGLAAFPRAPAGGSGWGWDWHSDSFLAQLLESRGLSTANRKTVILSDAKDLCNLPPAPRCPRLQRSLGPQKARGQDDKHQIRIANFALSISLLHAGIIRRVDVVELYR